MADVSQIKLPNGSVYDLIDEKSGYITADYIENKTDYEIPVSRVGEIVVGETAIGTDSTNFPTSKAVVDYVDERVVQEIGAIDVGVTSVNGKTGSVTLSASDVGALSSSTYIPQNTSDLYNDSGFITSDSDEKVKQTIASSSDSEYKPILLAAGNIGTSTLTASVSKHSTFWYRPSTGTLRVGGIQLGSNSTVTKIPTSTSELTNDSGFITSSAIPTNISSFTNDSGYLTSSDIASVLTYKGTKASSSALPSSGNSTGDVWHITDTGAEWAWDGSAWQELGTAIDLSNYATKATTLAGYGITDANIQNGTITLGSNSITPLTSFTETDPTVPSWAKASSKPSYGLTEISGTDDLRAIENLTGTSGLLKKTAANTWALDTNTYLTSYTETDPIFSASAASGITATDISNWNGKSSTDEKVKYTPLTGTDTNAYGILFAQNNGSAEQTTTVYSGRVRFTPSEGKISYYNRSGSRVGYLSYKELKLASDASAYSGSLNVTNLTSSRTYTLPDKTGTIALTSDIPQVYSSTNTGGYLTMATLPIYDGTVE